MVESYNPREGVVCEVVIHPRVVLGHTLSFTVDQLRKPSNSSRKSHTCHYSPYFNEIVTLQIVLVNG